MTGDWRTSCRPNDFNHLTNSFDNFDHFFEKRIQDTFGTPNGFIVLVTRQFVTSTFIEWAKATRMINWLGKYVFCCAKSSYNIHNEYEYHEEISVLNQNAWHSQTLLRMFELVHR